MLLQVSFMVTGDSVFLQLKACRHDFRQLNAGDAQGTEPRAVVLGPSGARATLLPFLHGTGQQSRDATGHAQWNTLFPRAENDSCSRLPPMVSVHRGSKHFQHPSHLVLIQTRQAPAANDSDLQMRSVRALLRSAWASLMPTNQEILEDSDTEGSADQSPNGAATLAAAVAAARSGGGGEAAGNAAARGYGRASAAASGEAMPSNGNGAPATTDDDDSPDACRSVASANTAPFEPAPTDAAAASKSAARKRPHNIVAPPGDGQPTTIVPESYSERPLKLDAIPKRFKRLPSAVDEAQDLRSPFDPPRSLALGGGFVSLTATRTENSPADTAASSAAWCELRRPSLLPEILAMMGSQRDAAVTAGVADTPSTFVEPMAGREAYFARVVCQDALALFNAPLDSTAVNLGASLDRTLSAAHDSGTPVTDLTKIGDFAASNAHFVELPAATTQAIMREYEELLKGIAWSPSATGTALSVAQLLRGAAQEGAESAASGVVDALPIPKVMLGNQDKWISISPNAVPLWDKLGLQPYGDQRAVRYVVVGDQRMEQEIKTYMAELTYNYTSCELGTHESLNGAQGEGWSRNMVPVNFKAGSQRYEDMLATYTAACTKVAVMLVESEDKKQSIGGGESWEHGLKQEHGVFVVYIVEPSIELSPLAARCLQESCMALLASLPTDMLRSRIVFQPIKGLDVHTAYGTAAVDTTLADMLRRVSFAVFLKSRKEIADPSSATTLAKLEGEPERLYVPLFVLTPRNYEQRWFEVTEADGIGVPPLAKLAVPQLNRPPAARLLHVAYCTVPGVRWVPVVWTDTDGMMLETSLVSPPVGSDTTATVAVLALIWEKTHGLIESTSLPWRVVVCKLGDPDPAETQRWAALFRTEMAKGQVDLSGTAPAIVSTSFISLQEFKDLRIFFEDEQEPRTDLTDRRTTCAGPLYMPQTRALVQGSPFGVFETNPAVLGTALLVTQPPALTVRSGRRWQQPGPLQPCTLLVALHLHESREPTGKGKYPLDSQCPRSIVRFLAEQLNALSWLTIALTPNYGRRSGLPFHITALQRLAGSIETLGGHLVRRDSRAAAALIENGVSAVRADSMQED